MVATRQSKRLLAAAGPDKSLGGSSDPPPTKRRRTTVTHKTSIPKKLVEGTENTVKNITKVDDMSRNRDILKQAKAVFRVSAAPDRLVGRDKERKVIQEFISNTVAVHKSGSLYLSGAPGTGKTALVEHTLSSMQRKDTKLIKVNCMTVGDRPKSIFRRIIAEMKEPGPDSKGQSEEQYLDTVFSRKQKAFYILMLDEIDQLITKDQDILYRIFGWAGLTNSRVCIIGIANSLDLTQRFLPRLQTKNCLPQVLPFPPYDVEATCDIIHDRIAGINKSFYPAGESLFQKAAVDLCARKVATTGDLRKALDICCQAIEFAEVDMRAAHSKSVLGAQLESPSKCSNSQTLALPKVTVQHVLRVLNNVFGAANPTVSKIRGLNPQQKLVMVLVVLIDRERRERKHTTHMNVDVTVSRLFDTYLNQCNKHLIMPAVSRAEFFVLLDGIASTGLLDMVKGTTSTVSGCSTPNSKPGSKKGTPLRTGTVKKFTPSKTYKSTPTKQTSIIDSMTRVAVLASEEDLMSGLDAVEFLKELLTVGLPKDAFPHAV